jgi:hypothetical protein
MTPPGRRLSALALAAAAWISPAPFHAAAQQPPRSASPEPAQVYLCPMHPDVRGRRGESCPKCGMRLVPAAADYTPYALDINLEPRALAPNQPGRVRLFVRDPATGAVVRRLEQVHDRVFHLFVVGRDLEYFAHVHPVLRKSGALDVDISVPRPGAYELIADFLPSGGAPQIVQRAFVTRGYTGPLSVVPAPTANLEDKTDRNVRVHLTSPDPRARREQLITFELRDPATGAPVEDIEPFLGANGHLLVVSADFGAVFHSHPIAEISSPHGPRVVFQVLFPQPGMYRLWAQFQRAGRVATVAFTIPIREID